MKTFYKTLTMMIAALLLGGCFDGGDGDNGNMRAGTGMMGGSSIGMSQTVVFSAFVKNQLMEGQDASEPATVNGLNFEFRDRENPDAFADVLQ